MNNERGFAMMAFLVVIGLIVLGGGGYIAMNPEVMQSLKAEVSQKDDGVQTEPGDHMEVDHDANDGMSADAKTSISWRFTSAGDIDDMPYTNVAVTINGTVHEMGKFLGSCSEIGATGGVDGKGLLAGELSAAQCWFAGGGNEIGVFAHEDGGFDILVGDLSEGEEGSGLFRGDFKVKGVIEL